MVKARSEGKLAELDWVRLCFFTLPVMVAERMLRDRQGNEKECSWVFHRETKWS